MKSKHTILLVIGLGIVLLMMSVGYTAAQDDNRTIYDDHFVLPNEGIYPEGIAYDPITHTFFVGSAVDGTILQGDVATGDLDIFVPSGRDGNTSVTGMKVDPYGRLWVSGAETGKIFVYDVASGELLRQYQIPPASETVVGFFTNGKEVPANLINDVTIAPDGDVYFTDTYSDLLYRISSTEDELGDLDIWLTDLGGGFINGIAITPDDRYLLVALSESGGLWRVDIESKAISDVILEGDLFADGILFDQNDSTILYAANFPPESLSTTIARVSFTAEDYGQGVVEPAFIEDETFNVSTTIAQVEGHLLVVNSQMFSYFDPSLEPTRPWIISNIDIPQD